MNANQPAYPQHGWSSDPETVARMQSAQGLTKRELIAAMALQGLLANPVASGEMSMSELVDSSIETAETLLEELGKDAKP